MRAEQKVLRHRHERKEPAALGHLHDAEVDASGRGHPRQVLAVEEHAAVAGRHQPGDHAQRGALAGGVGADEREDAARGHVEGDAEERLQIAVERVDGLKPQQG